MRRSTPYFLVFALATAVASACERRGAIEPAICEINEVGINDSAIGPLAIGEAVPALRERCPAIRDTVVLIPMVGWTDSVRALRLMVRNVPVLATYDSLRTTAGAGGQTVTALRVESPFFRTNDSVGVGTSIARFKALRGIRVLHTHDSPRVVLLDRRRCGVMYELSGWAGREPTMLAVNQDTLADEAPVSGPQLATWPDSIVISAVNVVGCRGNVRDLGVDSVAEAMDSTALAAQMPPATPAESLRVSELPSSRTPPPLPAQPAPPASSPATAHPSTVRPAGEQPKPIGATPAELGQLAALLDVPVQGVSRAQLRDTYAEPRAGHSHEALDILAPRGTPVLSATDGVLRKLHNSRAGGLMVYAGDASDRFVLLYGHLDRYADGVKEGMSLRRGQVIGYVGTSGNAPIGTPHLHFAILRGTPSQTWWRGTAVNPFPLLARRRPD